MVRVVYVGWGGDIAHHILTDKGSRLVAKRIDASTVVHMVGIVIDKVRMHLIVFHADKVAVPAPAEGDSCIGYIMNGVVVDCDA